MPPEPEDRGPGPDRPLLVTEAGALDDLCGVLAAEDRYALDTEFHLERTYRPRLALVQLAWADRVALVDPLAVGLAPLAAVFDGPGLAVAHASEEDLDILDAACGTAPARLFDTQVGARFLGYASPSLSRLVEQLLGVDLPKGDRLTDWLVRPLTGEQLTYAAGDVVHLLALHSVMETALDDLGRLPWALDECARALGHRRSAPDPETAWWKLGDRRLFQGRAADVAQEVAAWRERRASELDLPRRAVLSDLSIKAVASRPPATLEALRSTRGIERRHLANGGGEAIMAAVRRGRSLDPAARRLPPDADEERADAAQLSVAGGLVRHVADQLGFDPALLATRSDLAALLTGRPNRLEDGWRRAVVGERLAELAAGRLSVAFDPTGGLVVEDRAPAAKGGAGAGQSAPVGGVGAGQSAPDGRADADPAFPDTVPAAAPGPPPDLDRATRPSWVR